MGFRYLQLGSKVLSRSEAPEPRASLCSIGWVDCDAGSPFGSSSNVGTHRHIGASPELRAGDASPEL